MDKCLELRRPGLLGVAISGSGSSIIAFASNDEMGVAEALQKIFANEGMHSEVLFTSADNNGAGIARELAPLTERLGGVLQKIGRAE
jgi:homoserine kinase